MANPLKGEIGFTVEGEPWTLLYDFNALCTIEQDLGVALQDVGDRLTSPTMIRSIFRIGLEARHGTMTDLEAGRLIHAIGVETGAELIGKAFAAAFPEAGKAGANPPKPAKKTAGTSPAR